MQKAKGGYSRKSTNNKAGSSNNVCPVVAGISRSGRDVNEVEEEQLESEDEDDGSPENVMR